MADILPYEQVTVLDIDNGARFETYAIEGERGQVCLNGAPARLVQPGDKVIIITYADYEQASFEAYLPRVVHVDGRNRVIDEASAHLDAELHADRTGVTTGAAGRNLDVLVLGSGVAGLSAAVRLAGPGGPSPSLSLGVLTKGVLSQSATRWAQGGVAAVLGRRRGLDRPAPGRHAGGRGRPVRRGGGAHPGRRGPGPCARADRPRGRVRPRGDRARWPWPARVVTRRPRVVHAGGAATGAEVERALVDATYRSASAVLEGWFALDLLVEGGRCVGVLALPPGGAAAPVEVRGRPRGAGHRWRRPAVLGHDQPA